jgi:hypothetical protein
MQTTVHRALKITAFNANANGRQAYEVRKQLEDLKSIGLCSPVLREAAQTSHEGLLPNYNIYRTEREDGHKGGIAVARHPSPHV